MKCRYCKAEIPEGELYCKKCGREVQIVPDYNPLEEKIKDLVPETHVIGDAIRARRALDATKEAYEVASRI